MEAKKKIKKFKQELGAILRAERMEDGTLRFTEEDLKDIFSMNDKSISFYIKDGYTPQMVADVYICFY